MAIHAPSLTKINPTRDCTVGWSDMSIGAMFRAGGLESSRVYTRAPAVTILSLMDFVSTSSLTSESLDGSITARADCCLGNRLRFLGRIW